MTTMISVRIDDDLLKRLHIGASADGRTLSGYVIWAIRRGLADLADDASVLAAERPVPVGKAPKKGRATGKAKKVSDTDDGGRVVLQDRRAPMFVEDDRVDMSQIRAGLSPRRSG